MAPVLRDVQAALDSADGYEAADAALRRLEGKTRADGLESVLERAMMNGTSAGSIEV
jgi:phage gp29-like protein